MKSQRHLGCHKCVRRKLWKSGVLNLFLGWWCFPWGLLNPFAITWDFLRGTINRGPNSSLTSALDDAGVPYSFLEEKGGYEPGEDAAEEVVVRGLVRLGAAMMMADGTADEAEAETIRDAVAGMTDAFEPGELETMIEEAAADVPAVEDVVDGLSNVLSREGQELALALATEVALADEEVADEEVEMIEDIADAFGMEAEQ